MCVTFVHVNVCKYLLVTVYKQKHNNDSFIIRSALFNLCSVFLVVHDTLSTTVQHFFLCIIIMDLISFVVTVLPILLGFAWLFVRRKYSYWSDRNVPFVKPTFPHGNIKGLGKTIHISKLMQRFYNELKGRASFGGLFFFLRPVVLVTDLDLAKNILIKDFTSFQDRGLYYNEKDDPLSAHLFSLDGTKWKGLRSKITSTFTSGKMKFMFPTIIEVANQFQQTLTQLLKDSEVVEMKELLARFTTDIIGTCAFGINCNSLTDPNAKFRAMGKKVFAKSRNSLIVRLLAANFKSLAQKLHIKNVHDDVAKFFMDIVQETVEYREQNNINRNDFMDLLIGLKNMNKLSETESSKLLSMNEITAQAFVFFLAGFETSSTTMSYCLYELSLNEDIQQKVRNEINDVLAKTNGELTYEAMTEMHYLEQVINGKSTYSLLYCA